MKKILLSLLVACLGCAVSSNAQVILSQNFTGTTTPGMPTGWTTSLTVVTGTPALGWQTTTAATNLYFGTVSNAAPHTEYAVCNEYADTGNNPAGMISPTFSLVGVTAPYLNFDYVFFEAAYTTPPIVEKLWVDITTDGGTTWHNLDTLHAASVWSIKFESLIPYIGSANCKIRFMYSDLGRSFIGAAIGNIRIFNAPPTEIGLIATTPVAGSTTDYFAVGTGATLGGTIHNGGADTLTSFSASYQVGTDTVVTNMFTGLHIAPMANYDFHCTPYMVTALGTKPVSMWVTKAGDSLLSNDSMNTALIGVSFMPAKKIAVEEATGTWCGWCVRGIVFMDSLAKLYGNDISLIAVHNGDPMTVPAYDTWMGGRISGYPSVVVDRKFVDDPSNLLTIHDQHQNDFGFASITMMPTISGGDVTIPVTINPAINLTGGYKLVLVLTEDGVHSYSTVASTWDQHDYYSGGGYGAMNIDGWAGYNFATLPSVINGSVMYYNHVNRAIVPSPTGVSGYFPSGMVAGGSYTHTFTTPLMAGTPPTGWQISKMHAIVMLIDSATGNVLNSQNADLSLSHVCVGDSLTIMDSVSGGTFTSNATAIATVNSTTGVVMALSAGTVIITHTVGTAHYYTTIIVNPLPAPITGSSLACEYGVTVLSDMGIGTWSISDSSVASISASGVVTGFALGGTAIVTYTNTCGYTTKSITVGTAPYAGTISGASVICSGSLDTLMETMAGGTWTSSDTATMLTPISMGVVVNTSGGTTVTYTVTNACGMASVSQIINVNAMPVAGMVSGTSTLCQGASTTLMDSTMGGMWWSSDSAIASVNPSTGVVWGMGAGTTVIWYTVTNACGSASAGDTVMVNPLPMAGTIMGGTISLCNGDSTTFTSTVSGGMWHSMDTAKATIGATSGIVRSLGLGNDTLVYTVTNTCGTATDTTIVNITHTATAGTITGSSHVCVGSSITLADAVTGGTWRSYKPIIATVDATTGVVTGASYGIDTIWYRIAASCGVDSVSHVVVVDSVLPMVAAISGSSSFCQGQTKVYSDLVAGGVWSSMDTTIATINSVTGAATGVAGGTVVLEYTLSNTCSSFTATDTIVINPLPMVSAITGGTSSLCLGDSTIYMDTTHGGTWDIAIGNATISDMGHVTGVTLGIDTIRYTVSNTCGNTTVWSAINITSTATAGAITGANHVCIGSNIILWDAVAGGKWTSRNPLIATIDSTLGMLMGMSAGVDSITYTVTSICGTAKAYYVVTVNALPAVGTITGMSSVCVGSSITLRDSLVAGGTWSSEYGNVMFDTSAGVVWGYMAGMDTVLYTVTGTMCSNTAWFAIMVNSLPTVSPISGAAMVCAGSAITLTDTSTGVSWSAINGNAIVMGGVVTGVAGGMDTIICSDTNSCGYAYTTMEVMVNPLPFVAPILAAESSVCVGGTDYCVTASTGGVWSMGNGLATVAGGLVTGVASGTDSIYYTVANMCGYAYTAIGITINPLPYVSAITGGTNVCVAAHLNLMDDVAGGTWTSNTPTIATVAATTGIVTGVAAGMDTIKYSYSNVCGTTDTTFVITVNPLANPGTIVAPMDSICIGATYLFTDAVTGGTWSSSNPARASVNSTGTVTGVAPGTVTIKYSVTNGCGAQQAIKAINVMPHTHAPRFMADTMICIGSKIRLMDSITTGMWLTTNGMANIVSMDTLMGVAPGLDTILYRVTNMCGSDTAWKPIMVIGLPNAGIITGNNSVCVGDTTSLMENAMGGMGTWSDSIGHATISMSGLVTGVTPGVDTIVYSIANSCGETDTNTIFTVNALPMPVINHSNDSLWVAATYSTYQWYNNAGSPISGANQWFYVLSSSTDTAHYSVEVTNGNGCMGMSVIALAIAEVNATNNSISIYPNPTQSMLYIQSAAKVDAQIATIDGRVIMDMKAVKEMNLGSLPNGVYFITVFDNQTGAKLKTDRVVKAGN